jgi:uncharacterized protein (TIGR00730 family)
MNVGHSGSGNDGTRRLRARSAASYNEFGPQGHPARRDRLSPLDDREFTGQTPLMATIRSICVYCGSGPGGDPAFVAAARKFGKILAENHIRLIYGGGSLGLMGALANAVLDNGGQVTGIIPEFLTAKERKLHRAQEIVITRDMHDRKREMFERGDAFVALPGGIGTLEELVEQMTWAQLGRHKKPILIANIAGFWDPLCVLIDHMKNLHFIRPGFWVDPLVTEEIDEILPMLREAAQQVQEEEKEGTPATIARM